MAIIAQATPENLRKAAELLRNEGVVAFPTETVYGLGGRTFSRRAVEEIHRLKGRPADNPLIAHVLDEESAQRVAARWTPEAHALAAAFWPGPLTLVVPKRPTVPSQATGGRDSVAVRSPAHPIARKLLELLNGDPISAPSANISGHVSATCAEHVRADFAHARQVLVLDGGACEVGIESTVVDLCSGEPQILRPGSVSAGRLEQVLGRAVALRGSKGQGASPGTALSHYAPSTPAILVAAGRVFDHLHAHPERCAVLLVSDPHALPLEVRDRHEVIPMPSSAREYALVLYDRLRLADSLRCAQVVVEEPGSAGDPAWTAVLDRLMRATAAGS